MPDSRRRIRRQQNKAFKSWRNVRRGPETSLSPEIMYDGSKKAFGTPGVTYEERNKALGIVVWV